MIDNKSVNYFTPGLLALMIFSSNFLSTELFKSTIQNFSVWFILSVFAFACGWLINKTLNYAFGGKIVFAVNVAVSFITVIFISLFSEYFGLSGLLVENMVVYVLRNIMLGSMAYFGMAAAEVIRLQHESINNNLKQDELKSLIDTTERESKVIIEEAKLKSEKMIYEAQQKVDELVSHKKEIERRLKEFISVERDLLKKYEAEEE